MLGEFNDLVNYLGSGLLPSVGAGLASFLAAGYQFRRMLRKDQFSDVVDDKTQYLINTLTQLLEHERQNANHSAQTIQRLVKERDDAVRSFTKLEEKVDEMGRTVKRFDDENRHLRGLMEKLTSDFAIIMGERRE